MKRTNFSSLSFQNEIMKKTSQAKKSLQESKTIKQAVGNPTYREFLIENKMIQDGNFLASLGRRYLGEGTAEYNTFIGVITECIGSFNKLHMEVDIQPRLISPALNYDKALNENTKMEIYKDHFSNSLTKNFSQLLLEGKLFSKYEVETKLLLENVVIAGITDIDVEAFTKYALFESVLFDTMQNIIIPEFSRNEVNKFIGAQSEQYFEMFQENAGALYTTLNDSIKKMTLAIGPVMFNEANMLTEATYTDEQKDGMDDKLNLKYAKENRTSGVANGYNADGKKDVDNDETDVLNTTDPKVLSGDDAQKDYTKAVQDSTKDGNTLGIDDQVLIYHNDGKPLNDSDKIKPEPAPAVSIADDKELTMGEADNVGPINKDAEILSTDELAGAKVTVAKPIAGTAVQDGGFGLKDDAVAITIDVDPVTIVQEEQIYPELTPEITEELNASTNDGMGSDAPDLQLQEPYAPVKPCGPDVDDPSVDSVLDNLEDDRNYTHMESIARTPEVYTGIPVDQSVSYEESTNLSGASSTQFSYRQYAGASAIFKTI